MILHKLNINESTLETKVKISKLDCNLNKRP